MGEHYIVGWLLFAEILAWE